jgi:hypothetical protein
MPNSAPCAEFALNQVQRSPKPTARVAVDLTPSIPSGKQRSPNPPRLGFPETAGGVAQMNSPALGQSAGFKQMRGIWHPGPGRFLRGGKVPDFQQGR